MYSPMSKGIFLFCPCTYVHCTRFPTFTCFKCKSHFFGARIFISHLPGEGYNYVQLIRSDGTPPTQAPPSNSGCRLRLISPPWRFVSVSIQEAQDQSPRYEVAVYFPVQKKLKISPSPASSCLGWTLVAGSPQGGALTLRRSEGVSVGQQSLSELRLTVRVGAPVARQAGQLHRLVEGLLLRWRARRRLSRSAP